MENDAILAIINAYNLPTEQNSVVKGLVFAFHEGRIKPENIEYEARVRLTNSIACTASGMQDFEQRLQNALLHFRRFNREHPWRSS